MKSFYFTFGSGQEYGPGYTEIRAQTYEQAREIMNKRFGNKWSFQYEKLEDINPLDREYEIIWREPVRIRKEKVNV